MVAIGNGGRSGMVNDQVGQYTIIGSWAMLVGCEATDISSRIRVRAHLSTAYTYVTLSVLLDCHKDDGCIFLGIYSVFYL